MSMIPFDDRDGFIWYDGRLVPWRDAKLHVLNHGLHYASCVFEGERVYNGRVFRLEDHNERLINSARVLGFEVPAGRRADGRVGAGEQDPLGARRMGLAAYFSPEARAKGIRMQWAKWARPAPDTAPTRRQPGSI